MYDKSIFPTEHSLHRAQSVGLVPPGNPEKVFEIAMRSERGSKKLKKAEKYYDEYEKLKEFQHIAVMSDFDEAVRIYDKNKLTKAQKKALREIYSFTRPSALGNIIDHVMIQLRKANSTKETVELSKVLLEALKKDASEIDVEKLTGGFNPLIINTT